MMGSRLLYFGPDLCYRLTVMRTVGYRIAECSLLTDLASTLAHHPDAILLAGESQPLLERAVTMARAESCAPLVLFDSDAGLALAVDLIIPLLAGPDSWLREIDTAIERFQQNEAAKKTGEMSVRVPGLLEQMPQKGWWRHRSG